MIRTGWGILETDWESDSLEGSLGERKELSKIWREKRNVVEQWQVSAS